MSEKFEIFTIKQGRISKGNSNTAPAEGINSRGDFESPRELIPSAGAVLLFPLLILPYSIAFIFKSLLHLLSYMHLHGLQTVPAGGARASVHLYN